jgi:phage shock protein PspC (stress-responsive transcriptional regulator)
MRSPSRPVPRAAPPARQQTPRGVVRADDAPDRGPPPRLWRSRADRVVAGVLGGLAEKFGWDAKPLRLLYALVTVGTMGMAVIPYLVVWAITGSRGARRPSIPLWRSRRDKIVSGVLGGLAERWGINSTILRGLYVVGTAFTVGVPGIVTYLVLWTGTRPLDESLDSAKHLPR